MKKPNRHLPQLPAMRCDVGCGDCCGIVPAPPNEYAAVVAYAKKNNIKPRRQGITCTRRVPAPGHMKQKKNLPNISFRPKKFMMGWNIASYSGAICSICLESIKDGEAVEVEVEKSITHLRCLKDQT